MADSVLNNFDSLDIISSSHIKVKPQSLDEPDDELEVLLKSALTDFSNVKLAGADKKADFKEPGVSLEHCRKDVVDVGNDAASSCSNAPTPADIFGNFGQAITSILDADPQVMQQIGQMAEAVEGKGNAEDVQEEFLEQVERLASSMSRNVKDEVSGGAGIGDGNGGDDINALMQMFLSRDILYPCLKESLSKYESYLVKNKSTLSSHDYIRYRKQHSLLKDVCRHYELEPLADSEIKERHFEQLLYLLEQIQALGQPPDCLSTDLGPLMGSNGSNFPLMPQHLDKCCIM